jgi:hypothetical protein
MSPNTFKVKNKKGEASNNSIFSFIERLINVDAMIQQGIPVKYLPHVLFVSFMGIIYIGNSHYTEKTVKRIAKLHIEVEELRADYTSLKAEYMFDSKQSEVAKKVSDLGLEESIRPPYKLEMK